MGCEITNEKQLHSIAYILGAVSMLNGGDRNFHLGGYSSGEVGDQVPQKLKQFADIVYRF